MYRSSDCAQRRAPAADSCEILHLLQWMASSCFARKGCAGRAPDRPLRGHRRTCNLGRIASPVRSNLVFGSDTGREYEKTDPYCEGLQLRVRGGEVTFTVRARLFGNQRRWVIGDAKTRLTLERLGIPRSTFYQWYDHYQEQGFDGLEDKPSAPPKVWNRIPSRRRDQILELALAEPDLSPREIAVKFTDQRGYYVC